MTSTATLKLGLLLLMFFLAIWILGFWWGVFVAVMIPVSLALWDRLVP